MVEVPISTMTIETILQVLAWFPRRRRLPQRQKSFDKGPERLSVLWASSTISELLLENGAIFSNVTTECVYAARSKGSTILQFETKLTARVRSAATLHGHPLEQRT